MGRYAKLTKTIERVETRREQPKRVAKADAMDRIVCTRKMFSERGTDPNCFFPFSEIAKLQKAREARRIRKKQKRMENMQDGNLNGNDELVEDLNGSFGRGERPQTNRRITSLPTAETAEMACLKLSIVKLTERVEFLESKLAAIDLNVITTGVLAHVIHYFQSGEVGVRSPYPEVGNNNSIPLPTPNDNSMVPTVPVTPSTLACIKGQDLASSINTATSAHASVTGDAPLAQAAVSPRQPARPAAAKMGDSNNLTSPLLSIASPEYLSVIEEHNQVALQLFNSPHLQKMSESMFVHNNDEENSADASQSKNFLTSLFGTARSAVKNIVKREIRGDDSEGFEDDEEEPHDVPHEDNDVSRATEERWLADVNGPASGKITVKTEKLFPI